MTDYATPDELSAILGPRWAICRNTPSNRERYGRCITRRQYAEAQRQALAARVGGEVEQPAPCGQHAT